MNNIDYNEKIKFDSLYDQWWNESGILHTLHKINSLRLKYILNCSNGLHKKKILDVGCGGGILSESMAKKGADVTGLDIGKNIIKIAKKHALKNGLHINYIHETIEQHAYNIKNNSRNKYDIITCMEVLEHIPNPLLTIQACSHVLKTHGDIFFSTINRTLKSLLFIIIGGEYVFNMLPFGTHQFNKFIKPSELLKWLDTIHLEEQDIIGLSYDIIQKKFSLSKDINTNYILYAKHF